jgi:predicted TIM-barrel fold metal-dependent hydrolase
MYSQNQLRFFVAEIGADRIIHSEDFPYVVRDNVSEFIEHADLSDDDRTSKRGERDANLTPVLDPARGRPSEIGHRSLG